MKIDERHLVQLAAVVQAGGVTEGAALLGLTQPAVSRTLSMLEKRLGEPLFVKGRRPLQPTPLGRALADHGQAMLAASRKASQLVDSFRQGQSGVVRVGGTPFFMDALISGMIADFQTIAVPTSASISPTATCRTCARRSTPTGSILRSARSTSSTRDRD